MNNSTFNTEDKQLELIASMSFIVVQGGNFFLGIPLNIYVIVLLTRAGGLDESVFFAVSQSVSEIIFALSTPLFVLCVARRICFTLLINFFTGIGMFARLMFQCLVCVERYLAVVHPVTFLKFKPLKYRLYCLIVGWIFALSCSIIVMCASNFELLHFFGSFHIFIVIVELFCCVSILKALKQPAPGKREDSEMSNTKKKAFKIVFIHLLTNLTQTMPLVALFILRNILSLATMVDASSITMAVNVAGGLVPPLFFLHRAGKLKFRRPIAKPTDHANNL